MNDLAIEIIQKYIADLEKQNHFWQKSSFKQNSYAKWAANELLECIKNRPKTSVIVTIEDFIRKMDRYSCMSLKNSYMFSVAHDTAEDILDIFLSEH